MGVRSDQTTRFGYRLCQPLLKCVDAIRHYKEQRFLPADLALGKRGEDLAHRYLRQNGFTILARNYHHLDGHGEVDIVARDGGILVFIEVKTRATSDFGSPERAIDRDKQRLITRAARQYALRANIPWNQVRFDVVSIVFANPPNITHLRDAFFLGRAI